MRNVSLRPAIAAAVLCAATPAFATNGMRMVGFGPIQNSMGGASVATSLDSATIVTNPAGMSTVGRRVDLAGTTFSPFVEYKADQLTPSGAVSGGTIESDRPVDFIPTLGAVYPLSEKLTVGFAALGTAGMGVDYDADLYASPAYTSYLNGRIAPAVSYQLTERLSLGAAVNLMFARMSYDIATADDSMNMAYRTQSDAFGIGGTLGLVYKSSEGARIGIAYETKSDFQDFEFEIPAHALNTPGGRFLIPAGTEKLAFDQPDVLTVGVAFNPLQALLVAVDVQWIRWTSVMGENLPAFSTDPSVTGASPWNMDWSDQYVFKLGAQYDVNEQIKVRGGYNWGDSPLNQARALENVVFPAIAEHHFTVGAGYEMGSLAFNASILYSPEATLAGGNEAQGIAAYETKMSQLSFDIGAAWKF